MKFFRTLLFLPPAASTAAFGVDLLHLFVIATTMLASLVVGIIAIYFTVRYRRRTPHQTTPRLIASPIHEGILAAVILSVFLVFWVIGYRQYVHMIDPPDGAEVVYVTAKQWMWKFSGAAGDSNDVLTVPVDRPVKLVMTSRDVIHSFYVPAFRIKQDVIPGRYVTTWFQATIPGRYPIYCAEYCGVSHSMMRGEVRVLTAEDYAAWLGRRIGDGAPADLALLGREVAERHACVACHTFDGQKHVGPSWGGLYGSWVVLEGGRRIFADEEYLTKSMMEPQSDIVAGYRKVVMPTYLGALSQPDVAALVAFIKSLRDDPISPAIELPNLEVSTIDAGTGGPVAEGGAP